MKIQKKEKSWAMVRNLVIMLVLSAACMISGAVLLTGCNNTPAVIKGPDVQGAVYDLEAVSNAGIRYGLLRSGYEVAVIGGSTSSGGRINIPDTVLLEFLGASRYYTVVQVDAEAFKNNTTIQSVSFPESAYASNRISIGDSAFEGCRNMTSLSLGGELISRASMIGSIGKYAFAGCTGLRGSLTIDIASIGEGAFQNCGFDGSLRFEGKRDEPITIATIPTKAFQGCSSFTGALTIPNSVSTIGDNAFNNCGFNAGITIGSGVTTIGISAFEGCGNFTGALTIPASVRTINNNAFKNCGFNAGVTIQSGVTTIGASAFEGCSNLTGALAIPAGVTSLGASAFAGCSKLSSLTIGTGLGTINDNTFKGCSLLASMAFGGVTTIGVSAFEGCRGSGALSISSVTSIGASAFKNCTGFTSISTFASGLTSIAASTFEGCTGLTGTLTIRSSVTSIAALAFSGARFSVINLQRAAVTTLANINALPARPSPLFRIGVPAGAGATYRAAARWSDATVRPYICEATVQLHFNAGLPPENCDQVIGTVNTIGTSGAPVWSMATFPALPNGGFSVPNNSWKQIGWSLDPNIANRCLLFGETLADTDFKIGADIVPEWLNGTSMTFYPVWERAFTRGTVILHNVGGPNGGLGINAYFDFDPSDEETYKLYSAEFMNERGHELEFQGWYMSTSLDLKTKIKLTETDDDGMFIIPWTEAPFAGLFPVVHVFARWG